MESLAPIDLAFFLGAKMGEWKFFAMKALPCGQSCHQVIYKVSKISYFIFQRFISFNSMKFYLWMQNKKSIKLYKSLGGRIAHLEVPSS